MIASWMAYGVAVSALLTLAALAAEATRLRWIRLLQTGPEVAWFA